MRICSGSGCSGAVPDDVTFCDECKPGGGGIKTHHAFGDDGIRENVPAGQAGPSYRNGLKLSGNDRAKDDPIQREYTCRRGQRTLGELLCRKIHSVRFARRRFQEWLTKSSPPGLWLLPVKLWDCLRCRKFQASTFKRTCKVSVIVTIIRRPPVRPQPISRKNYVR
jgi:hypothetical protein